MMVSLVQTAFALNLNGDQNQKHFDSFIRLDRVYNKLLERTPGHFTQDQE